VKDLISAYVVGGFVSLLGLGGLTMSAWAQDGAIHGFGLGVFVFAVLFVFHLLKSGFDAAQRGSD
jgi:hypothetical protein